MKVPGQCGVTMEDPSSQNHNGQLGPSSSVVSGENKQNGEAKPTVQYSIPGILHFIQHEWARFELERSQWEVDRAELQARIAFLQGERKGQENLKNDLVRRIKMLEYVLREERAKFHKLKYGTDLQQGDMKAPVFDEAGVPEVPVDGEAPYTSVSNISWKQGRQLLRQYLQEIGYTDTIIDVRSVRVRSMLGLHVNAEAEENQNNTPPVPTTLNGNESNKNAIEPGRKKSFTSNKYKEDQVLAAAEAMMLETEAAVMANFDFLSHTGEDLDDEDMSDDLDDTDDFDQDDVADQMEKDKDIIYHRGDKTRFFDMDGPPETNTVLNDLIFLPAPEENSGEVRTQGDTAEWSSGMGFQQQGTERQPIGFINEEETTDSALGLGDLAQLTVTNESEAVYGMATATKELFRKTWSAKYTLRSHFDNVRALVFHPVDPVLITASEDHTLKLWNLQKTLHTKKNVSLDVEPLYTFRSHTGPVLCLAMSTSGEQCFSGGLDGAIYCWKIPSSNIDPYDSFDPSVLMYNLEGHTDGVWGLSIHKQLPQLLSCSADGTVKLWSTQNSKTPLLSTYTSEQDGTPTSIDFVQDEPNRMVAAYASSHCVIYDLETGKQVIRLDSNLDGVNKKARQINRVVSHPTLPLTISAYEDRHIRFHDNKTGQVVHSMVAHLEAVTSLAVDPNGLYLLSGSHDCSIRLWNLESKTCVQEVTAHRRKFDESILDVAFHPSRPYIASAGADALAKVFV